MSAGITLVQANEQLEAWLQASISVSSGQAYSIAGRALTRANAAEIRTNITYWDNMVKRLTRGGIRVRGATPSW